MMASATGAGGKDEAAAPAKCGKRQADNPVTPAPISGAVRLARKEVAMRVSLLILVLTLATMPLVEHLTPLMWRAT